jgi:hypothetical protein
MHVNTKIAVATAINPVARKACLEILNIKKSLNIEIINIQAVV